MQDGQFDHDTQADAHGVAGQVAPHEVEAQDQAAQGRAGGSSRSRGRGTTGSTSIITENDIARRATVHVEALGRIRPMPRKAASAQSVSPA